MHCNGGAACVYAVALLPALHPQSGMFNTQQQNTGRQFKPR
jgi:hypothetical protein